MLFFFSEHIFTPRIDNSGKFLSYYLIYFYAISSLVDLINDDAKH